MLTAFLLGGIGKLFGKAAERAGRVMRRREKVSVAAKAVENTAAPNFGKVKV